MIEWLLMALALFQGQPAKPEMKLTGPRLFCEARTPTGATLSATIDQVALGNDWMGFITGRDGSAWPVSKETFVLEPSRRGQNETEYKTGANLIRLKNEGFVRDLTFWSTRDGKALQPVAFGFCVAKEFPAAADTPPPAGNPFDQANWKPDCQMTVANPTPQRSTFKMNHNTGAGKRLFIEFEGLAPSGKISVPREMMASPPPTEHPDIFMGVGRFKPETGALGASGMEAFYLDRKTSKGSAIVRLTDVNGDRHLRFGICGSTITKVERG